ncbi:MAG: UPF0758 domain-containing protein [Burkholderia sp.]
MTDVELIALLLDNGISTGRAGETALHVFEKFDSLRTLLDASSLEIKAVHGVGGARSTLLIATTELVRRALAERARRSTRRVLYATTCG